jgi:ribose transport system permease protein
MENKRNFIDVIKRIKANNSNYSLKDISTILVLIILWIALSTISDNFFTIGNFNNILLQSANVMLVSVGMTFIIICGHIDLSVGSIEAFAGAVIAVLVINYKLPLWLSLVLGLGVGLLCGTVSGFLVAKLRFPAFVATLGMDSIARGLALLTTGGQAVFGFPEAFKFIGQGYV